MNDNESDILKAYFDDSSNEAVRVVRCEYNGGLSDDFNRRLRERLSADAVAFAPLAEDYRLLAEKYAAVEKRLRRRWLWPSAFSAMSAVAATLLVLLLARGDANVAARTIVSPTDPSPVISTITIPASVEPTATPTDFLRSNATYLTPSNTRDESGEVSYIALREKVLRDGVDALPRAPSVATVLSHVPSEPLDCRSLLRQMLKEQAARDL